MASQNTKPWLEDVEGNQVLDIINLDADLILVEAGPGTGKTFGLVRRVQRILHPQGLNVPGEDVLVVAFNRAIAKQLRNDIYERLNNSLHDGKPVICTVHALCLDVLRSSLRILLPHEVEAMIYDVLCDMPQFREKFEDQPHAQQAFENHAANLEDHIELWQSVDSWLRRHDAIHITELPSLLTDRLKWGDFSDKNFTHIIVDEFQDLTPIEQELFLKLRGERGKLVALGDPRQSIYTFRGNDPEGLDKINKLPASSVKISMTECRRCPAEIVEAANRLMIRYKTEPMVATSNLTPNVHVVVWKSSREEVKGMARAIVENIAAHPEEQHLAMVTRREFGYWIREEISKQNINLKIDLSFSESMLETWSVREAFLYFCLRADPDAPTWRAWLGYQNSYDGRNFKADNRNADAYLKFLSECNDRITDLDVQNLASRSKQPPGSGGKNLWHRAKRLIELKEQIPWDGEDAVAFLKDVFDSSKWNADQSPNPDTATLDMKLILSKACDLYHELENPTFSEQQKLMEVAVKLRYGIATREQFAPDEQSDLQVATLWGAKGVTTDHVYLIGLCNEAIPGPRRDNYPGTNDDHFEEQRRLFYVSITRSKKTLVLSRAEKILLEDARRLGLATDGGKAFYQQLQRTDFLRQIKEFLPPFQYGNRWKGCV